jgi:hypothetical protein
MPEAGHDADEVGSVAAEQSVTETWDEYGGSNDGHAVADTECRPWAIVWPWARSGGGKQARDQAAEAGPDAQRGPDRGEGGHDWAAAS